MIDPRLKYLLLRRLRRAVLAALRSALELFEGGSADNISLIVSYAR